MNLALPNITEPVFNLDEQTLQAGLKASRKSSRLRMILPLHRTQDALVQRMVNFLQPGTYIRSHMHPLDHAVESIMLLQGSLSFFIFDKSGNVTARFDLNGRASNNLVDIEPLTWHSFIVTKPDTVIFEVKRGPYNPETDKTFADWAPDEGSKEAVEYMESLKQATITTGPADR